MSRKEMNWLFRMIYQAVSSSFSPKPVSMSDVIHIAIQRITISESINDWIAREDTHSATNHTTEKNKRISNVSLPPLTQRHLAKDCNIR